MPINSINLSKTSLNFLYFLKTINLSPSREICLINLSIIHVTSGKYPWVKNVSRLLPEVSRVLG